MRVALSTEKFRAQNLGFPATIPIVAHIALVA